MIHLTGNCEHLSTTTETAVYRLHNETDPDRPYFTVALKVFCPECKVLFRFLGDHAGVPEDANDAIVRRLGCWTSDTGDELGALISPNYPGSGLAQVAVLGRA